MVTLPPALWRDRDGLAQLIDTLGGGEVTRVVGGAVRDTLLGRDVTDIDLATRLQPAEVMARLKAAGVKAVPTGLAHGTITAVPAGGHVEVTTLRRDVSTDGRHATVEFSDDWREDAARRDFTINALYADTATGEVFDYFDGAADIAAHHVRFIGDPLIRIAEDHLRILRFFRFHARFGKGPPDAAGLAACAARANDLMALSRERIAAELLKLLAADDPSPVVAIMIDHGIFKPVLPEFTDATPLARCVAREKAMGVSGDAVRRLAALIDGRAALAASIGGRLKLSKAVTNRLVTASEGRPGAPGEMAYRLGTMGAIDRLILGNGSVADVARVSDWAIPKLPITGGVLIARGLTPGPIVAKTLAAIETRWVDSDFPTGDVFDAIVAEEISRAS
jgi:poly(A) polymerase